MQLTHTIFFTFVCIGLLCISNAGGEICSCSCCVGVGCKMIEEPTLSIPSCDNDACPLKCKQTYPTDCNNPQSQTVTFCTSGASIAFSRYTTLTTLFLTITTMKSLRF